MKPLPTALYTPEQVAALDRTAIETLGIPGPVLMERAGVRAWSALRACCPGVRAPVVLCGGGNNGGDGYVVARLALEAGLPVRLLALSDPARLQGAAAVARDRYRDAGGAVEPFDGGLPPGCDGVVDALLGTGLQRPVAGDYAGAVDAVNASGLPVLAVDIPSGLHGGTGAVLGRAVRATATVTFIGLKRGLFTGQGPAHCGTLRFDALALPDDLGAGEAPAALRDDAARLPAWFPPRPRDAHKGTCGRVAVLGGDRGMAGAAALAGQGALRAGAGLVAVVTRPEHAPGLLGARPELMVRDPDALAEECALADALVLGPGLGTGAWGDALFAAGCAFDGPVVVDADGLNRLAAAPVPLPGAVLTPHPGEAARLLGRTTDAVQADRPAAAAALAERYQAVVVLKGSGTVVADGDGQWICSAGNPGMASGGMGDVLAGVIGALLGQGFTPVMAARAGVCLHAAAGDQAATAGGERGVLASDLLGPLRALANPGAPHDGV